MADRLDLLGSRRRNGSTERDSQADVEQADNEIYIDAVHQYIHAAEWSTVIGTFCDSHCSLFARESGACARNPLQTEAYDHGTWQCFCEFRQMAEALLEGLLGELGVSPKGFVEALENYCMIPSNGPREETIKDLLSQLLLLEDYEAFVKHMEFRNAELETAEYNEGTKSRLTAKGDKSPSSWTTSFSQPVKAIGQALVKVGTAMVGAGDEEEESATNSEYSDNSDDEDENDGDRNRDEDAIHPDKNRNASSSPHVESTGLAGDDEWKLQLKMALSLKEAAKTGILTDKEASLLGWADAILDLQQQRDAEGSTKDLESIEVHVAVNKLAIERFRVDLLSAQRSHEDMLSLSNKTIRDVATSHTGNSEAVREALLHSLLEQTEVLRTEIAHARGQAIAWCGNIGSPKHVGRESLEHAYLFLNEKIRAGEDLSNESVAAEIRNFFMTGLQRCDSVEQIDFTPLAPLLVSWLMLENASQMIEQRIQKFLAGGDIDFFFADDTAYDVNKSGVETAVMNDGKSDLSSCFVWDQYWDESSGHFYYYNRDSGESSWEMPSEGFVPYEEHGFEGDWWNEYADFPEEGQHQGDGSSDLAHHHDEKEGIKLEPTPDVYEYGLSDNVNIPTPQDPMKNEAEACSFDDAFTPIGIEQAEAKEPDIPLSQFDNDIVEVPYATNQQIVAQQYVVDVEYEDVGACTSPLIPMGLTPRDPAKDCPEDSFSRGLENPGIATRDARQPPAVAAPKQSPSGQSSRRKPPSEPPKFRSRSHIAKLPPLASDEIQRKKKKKKKHAQKKDLELKKKTDVEPEIQNEIFDQSSKEIDTDVSGDVELNSRVRSDEIPVKKHQKGTRVSKIDRRQKTTRTLALEFLKYMTPSEENTDGSAVFNPLPGGASTARELACEKTTSTKEVDKHSDTGEASQDDNENLPTWLASGNPFEAAHMFPTASEVKPMTSASLKLILKKSAWSAVNRGVNDS